MEASPGATRGEPDQVFGVLYRAGEEACGESPQGGGGCKANVAVETTLTSEVSALQEGQQRDASLLAEASRMEEQPPTMPVDFAAELVQLRSLVAELQREREELQFELG